jgi:hypothetical protein
VCKYWINLIIRTADKLNSHHYSLLLRPLLSLGRLVPIDNPGGDPVLHQLPRVLRVLGVCCVGLPQLQVMSASMNDFHIDVGVPRQHMRQPAGPPWIQVSIGEYYVGHMQEVAVGVASPEEIEHPVELGVEEMRRLALAHEGVGVPQLRIEKVSLPVLSDRHHHFIANLVVPTVVIETSLEIIRLVCKTITHIGAGDGAS